MVEIAHSLSGFGGTWGFSEGCKAFYSRRRTCSRQTAGMALARRCCSPVGIPLLLRCELWNNYPAGTAPLLSVITASMGNKATSFLPSPDHRWKTACLLSALRPPPTSLNCFHGTVNGVRRTVVIFGKGGDGE